MATAERQHNRNIIYLDENDDLTLTLLYTVHDRARLKGRAIVYFQPNHWKQVMALPGIIQSKDYKFTKPTSDREIGGVELFHLVPCGDVEDDYIR